MNTTPRKLTDAELAEITRWVRLAMKQDRAEHIARTTIKRLAA